MSKKRRCLECNGLLVETSFEDDEPEVSATCTKCEAVSSGGWIPDDTDIYECPSRECGRVWFAGANGKLKPTPL